MTPVIAFLLSIFLAEKFIPSPAGEIFRIPLILPEQQETPGDV
jgi:hypothetical protein